MGSLARTALRRLSLFEQTPSPLGDALVDAVGWVSSCMSSASAEKDEVAVCGGGCVVGGPNPRSWCCRGTRRGSLIAGPEFPAVPAVARAASRVDAAAVRV